jgi:hypothetical protein
MQTKTKIIITVVYTVAVAAAGRYLGPEKIKIETKTIEVAKKVQDVKKKKKKDTDVVIIKKPDGTEEIHKHITENDNSDSQSKTDETKQTDRTKEVTRGDSKVTLSALAGFKLSNGMTPVYGISASKALLGPFTFGAFGLSDTTFGLSLGLQF